MRPDPFPFRWILLILVFISTRSSPVLQAQVPGSQPDTLPELDWHLTARPWQPLNTSRTNLLDKVEDIVNALAPLQYWNTADPGDVQDGGDVQNGAIIDPFELKEWQYGTPYFSFAVATAVANGRSTNLCEIGARALDHATADIAGLDGNYQANDSHGEFFAAPMMKALRLYKQIAAQYPAILTSARIARWESRLTTSRTLYMNNGVPQNWRTYGMKGEWLRVQDGLVPRSGGAGGQGVDYIENYWLNEQRARYLRDRDTFHLNPYFLSYHDDDPGPKQNFSYMGGATGNLLDMVYNGYDGASRAEIEEITRFCVRSCLLFVAGSGDAPAGGRTGDHVWNDIVYGNTLELAAEMAWAEGDTRLAGQYRRAARLAFQSAWRFQQEQGWFSVTKSLIHPSHQNHYASWSALANYNGYTEIHSSEAFATELSDIPEEPAPAEIGGYVATLDEQFDNTFVNAGGMQVQICTEGSSSGNVAGGLRWYSLGIVRFSRPGWESRLGPGDGWIKSDGSEAISFAPTFYESGAWQMVAQQPDRFMGVFTPSFTHPLLIRGTLTITPKSGQSGPSFAMSMIVTPDGVLVDTSRTSGANSFGITWPLMEFDGKHVLSTEIGSDVATTAYPKMSSTQLVTEAESASLSGGATLSTVEPGYSGTGYAVFPSNGGAIQWTGVEGGDGGAATVGFRYTLRQSTAASRTVTLRVNGQPRSVTFEHTGNPSTYGGSVLSFPMVWHQIHLPVTLGGGSTNIIRLEAGTAGGLNIDELRAFPADSAQPEPDQQVFMCVEGTPNIDASTPVRRTAYGDQRPVRVTQGDNPVITFVYPRTAGDPTGEEVRSSFSRNGTNFTSALGRVEGNLYVGRTSAGGVGAGIDVEEDGTNEVDFSQSCGFVVQLDNGTPTHIEADAFVTATRNERQVKLAPYTPIDWSDTETLWNNVFVAADGLHFEATLDVTPPATNSDIYLGFAGQGMTAATHLVAALRFGADGLLSVVPGPGLVELPYQAGVPHHLRAEFDLITRRYSIWVTPDGDAEQQLVANASLPAEVTAAADLDTFAYFTDASAASAPVVTPLPELSLSIASPAAEVAILGTTNDTLLLVGVVSNGTGSVSTTWAQQSGPGVVTFGDSTALATTAHFGQPGAYEVTFSADGTILSTGLTVVVASSPAELSDGLTAWWKMDESGGLTAADSSGNGRDATLVNGAFVAGYLSNAVQFISASSRATYSAADGNQLSVAAWVRCDATGGGSFPRIVNAPSWRLMFRFASSDPYSIGFATEDSTYGDWDSGGGSIGLGQWTHVAVTYDRSNLGNLPVFYINGVRRSTLTLQMPSGTPPSFSGTGYIGNNWNLNRAWNGLIDDLRIYGRVLSDSEVFTLSLDPSANFGPAVFAGTNQTLFWPAVANLSGAAADDGNPTPPAMLTTTWSQVSGPGTVSFGNPNALSTTAGFSAPGDYDLQLSADDGQVQTISRVTIEVLAPPSLVYSWEAEGLRLTWPTDGANWQLQSQTNPVAVGLGTNWVDVPGTLGTNQVLIPKHMGESAVFYRLKLDFQ